MKRLFIAIPVQDTARAQISWQIINCDLARKMPVRWTPYENLHLTVQFLGDVEEKRIKTVEKILEENAGVNTHSEKLCFANFGAFPNLSAPKILWLGFKKNDYLLKLQHLLTLALVNEGLPVDHKAYKPHLTLGRVRENSVISVDVMSKFEETAAGVRLSDSPLDRICLYESQLRPGGPKYTALYETKLPYRAPDTVENNDK